MSRDIAIVSLFLYLCSRRSIVVADILLDCILNLLVRSLIPDDVPIFLTSCLIYRLLFLLLSDCSHCRDISRF